MPPVECPVQRQASVFIDEVQGFLCEGRQQVVQWSQTWTSANRDMALRRKLDTKAAWHETEKPFVFSINFYQRGTQ
jgi:hypothetical protein